MGKKLNTEGVVNELKGKSAFFKPPPTPKPSKKRQAQPAKSLTKAVSKPKGTSTPTEAITGSKVDMVESIRKRVKQFGKEAATHRFTLEEKKILSDLIYAYKGQGIKTSENEVTRIAINYINEDYKKNGENSVLDKVLQKLHT